MVKTLHPSTDRRVHDEQTMRGCISGAQGLSPGLHAVLAHENTSATILVKMDPDSAPRLP